MTGSASARDRLLVAAAQLLEESGGAEVSTRAMLERAGVQAPTLYHHFGSKQALLDLVVSHGFRDHLEQRRLAEGPPADPIVAVRDAWDAHVDFGLEHPGFYTHVYGTVRPGQPCAVTADVEAMILATLEPAARAGHLVVPPPVAATRILAASSGVILTLLTRAPERRDPDLSPTVRDLILASVTGAPATAAPASPSAAAITLSAALAVDPGPLSATEVALMREWLGRLTDPN